MILFAAPFCAVPDHSSCKKQDMEHSLSLVLASFETSCGHMDSSIWALVAAFIQSGTWSRSSFYEKVLRPAHEKCCGCCLGAIRFKTHSDFYTLVSSCVPVQFFILVWWCRDVLYSQLMSMLRKIFFSLVEVLISWKFRREEYRGREKKNFCSSVGWNYTWSSYCSF